MRTSNRVLMIVGALALGAGLIGWRAAETSARAKGDIGVVDVVALFEQMVQSPEFSEPLDAMREQFLAESDRMQQSLIDLQMQVQGMDQSDPQFAILASQFQSTQQQLQAYQQQKAEEFDAQSASQATESFRRIREATRAVGEREGYAYVVSSRTESIENAGASNAAMVAQQILATTVILGAEDNDLTEMVRVELGLPDPSETDAGDAAGAVESAVEGNIEGAGGDGSGG